MPGYRSTSLPQRCRHEGVRRARSSKEKVAIFFKKNENGDLERRLCAGTKAGSTLVPQHAPIGFAMGLNSEPDGVTLHQAPLLSPLGPCFLRA